MTTPRTPTSTRTTRKSSTSDAIALLKADHRKVEELFKEFEEATRKDRKEKLALEICQELTVHAVLEEKAFYPQAEEVLKDDTDLIAEARVEHSSLKWLIEQIESEEPGTEVYDAKVTVLKEYVTHHVKEEEKEMFPKLRKTDLDLRKLGEELSQYKQELTSQRSTH